MDANWRREAIVEILRQGEKVKARELADRFQVTRQTIYNDMETGIMCWAMCFTAISVRKRPIAATGKNVNSLKGI